MTQEMMEAGIPTTAPLTGPEDADCELTLTEKPVSSKIMVLAVHRNTAGKIIVTPIDVEHEDDDQSELSVSEQAVRVKMLAEYRANDVAMEKALEALFTMFDKRTYRSAFRTFENFCFALLGAYRIPEVTVRKAKARIKKLKTALEEENV